MDLGFTFASIKAEPRLMAIVPGLQRLPKRVVGGVEAIEEPEEFDTGVSRLYMSDKYLYNICHI